MNVIVLYVVPLVLEGKDATRPVPAMLEAGTGIMQSWGVTTMQWDFRCFQEIPSYHLINKGNHVKKWRDWLPPLQ